MGGLIITYSIGVVIPMIVALIIYIGEGSDNTRTGARIILLAPIWPLLFPWGIFRAFRWLWKTADWKGVEEEEETLRAQRLGRARGR